jgi:S-formylglutathione hydrolase
MKELPLILNLHGGGGSRDVLARQQALWDRLWESNQIPPVIVVTPSVTARGFYMNFRDGSERWEDFIIGPFLAHLRNSYPVTEEPKKTFLMGASMGGMGSLRIAFRYPDRFGAVAALEPGIEPILKWQDMRPKHRFWRADDLFERAYGKPVDPEYWAENNPASMVIQSADRIRESGLQIYVEAGDEDQFWLYEGAEFLHQVLWQQKIKHEYHLVRGGDHVGPSLGPRSEEAIKFLIRSYEPWGEPALRMRAIMKFINLQKLKVNEADHYNQPDPE